MLKAVIFDMDGVLINSPEYLIDIFNKILDGHNVKISHDDRKKTIGLSIKDQIKFWRERYNIEEEIDHLEFIKDALRLEFEMMGDELKPNESIFALVKELKDNGIKIAVATSSTKERAEKILELIGLKDKIDSLVAAEDVKKHKPHPEVFLKAAKELGADPENCIVFEDAINGIEAAQAAKMKIVARATAFNTREEFEEVSDLTFEDFSEITLAKLKELF